MMHQIGSHCGQTIVLTFRAAVFKGKVLALDLAHRAKTTAKPSSQQRPALRTPAAKNAYHRHRCGLLRSREVRAECSRTGSQHEVSTFHPLLQGTTNIVVRTGCALSFAALYQLGCSASPRMSGPETKAAVPSLAFQ
ncbi:MULTISPECIES: hypothetical protein [unclassified Bradyrhizobium]|uniref:hypothetical protein n=1 Tax=unclassified Bradyrhizobium TaxID=2631580 RepID=UPI001FFABF51|nr:MULTISPECIES: hypothetical protein [unclassified Bradyrhizobium]MCK1729201.1 hypothetical protein [Bradyrhizobium sp. 142]